MRGKRPGTLSRFVCAKCGEAELVTGGTSPFRCSACRIVGGETAAQRAQLAAHKAVAVAIRNGTLTRPAAHVCKDCARPALQYDHRDYSKPLEVDAVCRRCNVMRGPAIGSPAQRSTDQKARA